MGRIYQNIKTLWFSISLKQKLGVYTIMVVLVMGLSVVFNIRMMDYALGGFSGILDDNARCHDFQEAMELEVGAFENYVRNRSVENREEYVLSCVRSERCIRSLPYDYGRIGRERYARTWNVKNAYENYSLFREDVLSMDVRSGGYIEKLYRVYSMQEYIQTYARRLVQVTLTDGNDSYHEKEPVFRQMPYWILVFSLVMLVLTVGFTRILGNTLVNPMIRLAHCTRKIARNDFGGTDLEVPNQDEMGELVAAFNKMKHSTEGYINTLKKNSEMAELLHQEELERINMEKQLNSARLELLKSQINPHFLFNTLNMIGCMAKLEDASTTEKMIYSMGNLFRYTLKTSEQVVFLEQELKVVQDYIYIQQMRFGGRIRYDSSVEVDAGKVKIPSFSLQPVVENAIIHGLSKKEQGGRLHLRIWQEGSCVTISVTDTGLGMSEAKRTELEEALQSRRTSKVGIGLGNIYRRIHIMYEGGSMRIYSREGCGTTVQMKIPQGEENG